MKVKIDIPDEVVDEIILRELKIDYEMNRHYEQDAELANALLTVIKYHSTDQQYHDWIAGNKKVCCESHGGPVGLHCNHDHCTGPKLVCPECHLPDPDHKMDCSKNQVYK